MENLLQTSIMYLPGMGDVRASTLRSELGIATFGDLLEYYPYRHIDRTHIYSTGEIREEMPYVQLKGSIIDPHIEGEGRKKRLVARFLDSSGEVELIWFNSIKFIQKQIKPNVEYIIFGKPSRFGLGWSIVHPELDDAISQRFKAGTLFPVYSVTEKMKKVGISIKVLRDAISRLIDIVRTNHLPDTLPDYITKGYNMLSRWEALEAVHFPTDEDRLRRAIMRLKAEEIFWIRLRMRYIAEKRHTEEAGLPIHGVGHFFNQFFNEKLPFPLTRAQERVIREIYNDMRSGSQMNRLLQGDVGSGKTMVALLSMLIAADNGYQSCLMAPTEILAIQHAATIRSLLGDLSINVALLTGSTRKKEREKIHQGLRDGSVHIIIGTHALIEENVQMNRLGLAVIDEQHRFGVEHRSKLWDKNRIIPPHVLIMSATPIPRTLAMTLYGDLDVSVIDELPPGRTPIETTHRYPAHKSEVYRFMEQEIDNGRQAYVVFPLIEESEKTDMKNLQTGYEELKSRFPNIPIGFVHGKMKSKDKEEAMKRFVSAQDKILVSTTVIEVGVNVPNATIMLIEDANRFGLSQLHQLRGRVGRGAAKSYCILMTDYKLSDNGKRRMEIMTESTDGFFIAEQDLKLRGQGDLEGTQQSGVGGVLKMANLAKDGRIVQFVSNLIDEILSKDPTLTADPLNAPLHKTLSEYMEKNRDWGQIS
ncbi:ATP-dependent DNA helicase RecG [Porphyromonas canoris]|uniref:ATP-dependent DNA helicase RecG n=1 Tax=Porphyromonas canoris TaxID=36875 RepID=A0ABR4XJQ5_9PORP|nr:ATP-dependent DNA helicase RecG [Porphyromonas canoris]KGN91694.1 ATP-dependent DNA helicase RecG [Porphyromonas canoris]